MIHKAKKIKDVWYVFSANSLLGIKCPNEKKARALASGMTAGAATCKGCKTLGTACNTCVRCVNT